MTHVARGGLALCAAAALGEAHDPYQAAADRYRLAFEDAWGHAARGRCPETAHLQDPAVAIELRRKTVSEARGSR